MSDARPDGSIGIATEPRSSWATALTKGQGTLKPSCLTEIPLEQDSCSRYDSAKSVFFGRNWMADALQTHSPTIADFNAGVGEDGPLVAYRRDARLS